MKKNQWNGVMGLLGAAFLCGAVAVSEEMGWTDIGRRTLGITQLGATSERQGLPPVEERVYGISRIWKNVQENYTVKGEQRYHSDAFHVIQMEGNLMYLALKTEKDLGYIDEYFEKVVPILAEGEGVVLDVRKNTGGNSAVGHTIIESFMGSGIPECSSAPGTLKVSDYVNIYGVWSNAAQRTAEENWSKFAELYEQAQTVYGDRFQTLMDIGEEMHEGRFAVTEEMEELLEAEIQERMDGEKVEEPFETMWLDLVENSRVKGKPLVMLICSRTGASTDSTAASAKAAGVTLVGTRTKGSTGNLLVIDAGDGWYAAITTQRSLTPEGIDINNNGVEADVRVEIGAGDVVRGVDTQLVRAVEVLKEKISDQ